MGVALCVRAFRFSLDCRALLRDALTIYRKVSKCNSDCITGAKLAWCCPCQGLPAGLCGESGAWTGVREVRILPAFEGRGCKSPDQRDSSVKRRDRTHQFRLVLGIQMARVERSRDTGTGVYHDVTRSALSFTAPVSHLGVQSSTDARPSALEPVADPGAREQIPRPCRIRFKLLAQPGQIYTQVVGLASIGRTPDFA